MKELKLTPMIFQSEDGTYTAFLKEMKGAVVEGDTKEELIENLIDAFICLIEVENQLYDSSEDVSWAKNEGYEENSPIILNLNLKK